MSDSGHQRQVWIDHARGIAILLVVLGHAIHIVERQCGGSLPQSLLILDRIIYTFHVPVFFFLSGLFVAASYARRGASGLLWHRTKTLLYPYALWAAIQAVLEAVGTGEFPRALGTAFARILYFPPAHFWFLFVLFFCVVVSVGVRRVVEDEGQSVIALAVLAFCWYGLHVWMPAGPLRDMGASLPYFALGGIYTATRHRIRPLRSAAVRAVLAWCVFVGAASLAVSKGLETAPLLRLPLGILGVTATCMTAILVPDGRKGAWLAHLGRRSLVIYLTHVIAIHVVLVGLGGLGVYAALCIAMLAGVALPLVLDWGCQRLRLSSWLGLR
jgi:fucose 4-O-acetylase-like acetyltransferase